MLQFTRILITAVLGLSCWGCASGMAHKTTIHSEVRNPRATTSRALVYGLGETINRPHTVMGSISVSDSERTLIDDELDSVLLMAIEEAQSHGADALHITSVEQPGFLDSTHRIRANFIAFDKSTECVLLLLADFLAYLETDRRNDIEGIWQAADGTCKLGIQEQGSGRYVAFILESDTEVWQRGEIKITFKATEDDAAFTCDYIPGAHYCFKAAASVHGSRLKISYEDKQGNSKSSRFVRTVP